MVLSELKRTEKLRNKNQQRGNKSPHENWTTCRRNERQHATTNNWTSCQQNSLIVGLILLGIFVLCFDKKSLHLQGGGGRGSHIRKSRSKRSGGGDLSYQLAYDQSHGFFQDISDADWKRLQEIARDHFISVQKVYKKMSLALGGSASIFDYFEPDFSCPYERRLGIPAAVGWKSKWVCDPHRLALNNDNDDDNNNADNNSTSTDNKCLIYSVKSEDFHFETAIHDFMAGYHQTCEIHTFNANPVSSTKKPPSSVTVHNWGISSTSQPTKSKSLKETIETLGHQGRTIDILKMDCDGCTWPSHKEWVDSDVAEIRQILVELKTNTLAGYTFFEDMMDAGYAIAHKEGNLEAIVLTQEPYYEYTFLKLDTAFRGFQFHNRTSSAVATGISH